MTYLQGQGPAGAVSMLALRPSTPLDGIQASTLREPCLARSGQAPQAAAVAVDVPAPVTVTGAVQGRKQSRHPVGTHLPA